MQRTCEKCGEEFELRPDHPGRSVICRSCIKDPEREARMNHEVEINGESYTKAGLTMQSEPIRETKPRIPGKRKVREAH